MEDNINLEDLHKRICENPGNDREEINKIIAGICDPEILFKIIDNNRKGKLLCDILLKFYDYDYKPLEENNEDIVGRRIL